MELSILKKIVTGADGVKRNHSWVVGVAPHDTPWPRWGYSSLWHDGPIHLLGIGRWTLYLMEHFEEIG